MSEIWKNVFLADFGDKNIMHKGRIYMNSGEL
jgi:hypothetical protein